jgi:hypothetical protein
VADNTDAEGETIEMSIEDLAAQMLGLNEEDENDDEEEEDEEDERPQVGHPAWRQILNSIPEEYHDAVIPTLQRWDSGVSRRFQRIHDEYAPYKELGEFEPDSIKEAMNVYQALTTDPAATWEAIGRVYGLSPQQVSQAASQDEDFDLDDLPASIRERLDRIDNHDQTLNYLAQQLQQQQAYNEEAAEDEALEEYLNELREDYGDFDEDYVVGLIAAGMDGEDAVGRFQALLEDIASNIEFEGKDDKNPNYPQVMGSGGGVPDMPQVDTSRMSDQDTRSLVAEILRLSHDD